MISMNDPERHKGQGLSITEYAKQQGVDKSTVHRWINKGLLTYELTPSGRKRITGVKKTNG